MAVSIVPRLSDETEDVVHRVIGCCIQVHRELGPGLLEGIYRRALCVELRLAGIAFEPERRVPVIYKSVTLAAQRLDVVASERVLVELKSADRLGTSACAVANIIHNIGTNEEEAAHGVRADDSARDSAG